MHDLGVLWGYGTRDELETAGADRLVESTADLARTVLSMIGGKSARESSAAAPSSGALQGDVAL